MDLLSQQKEWNEQKFKGVVFRNDRIGSVEFNSCKFSKCSFRESIFQECWFRDCVFSGCDLSMVKLTGCKFSDTRFEDSQVIGVDWTETSLAKSKIITPVNFFGCAINHSTFVELELKKINIARCVAHDVDFLDANLTQANCAFTDFTNSHFYHTNLTEADFTGAKNYTILASENTLKKTKFSLPEAMALLYGLDIVLTEYEEG
jgi:fluoroquinolone resistance protein